MVLYCTEIFVSLNLKVMIFHNCCILFQCFWYFVNVDVAQTSVLHLMGFFQVYLKV